MSDSNVAAQLVQLDWLTMTTLNEDLGIKWIDRYVSLLSYHPELHGSEERYFNWQGYHCRSIPGSLLVGTKDNGECIFQAISSLADDCFPITYGQPSRVTRLDLAVTVELDEAIPDLAARHYKLINEAMEVKEQENGTGSQRTYTLYENSRGGSTLYVGSRTSDQFGRMYDKGRQRSIVKNDGDYEKGKLWRYEVSLKKPRASPMAVEIANRLSSEGFSNNTRKMMTRYVYNWFLSRFMIQPVFAAEEVDTPKLSLEYTETSAARKLRWIQTQVRPAMIKLLDMGFGEELQEALGYRLVPTKQDTQLELPF